MVSTERKRALKLWLLCTLVLPFLWIMQALQGLFGSVDRSINMATALDSCGNALFGGDPRMTISEHTGLALMDEKRWGKIVAPIIDFFFGVDHCHREAIEYIKELRKKNTTG